jgi:hypothetical protein
MKRTIASLFALLLLFVAVAPVLAQPISDDPAVLDREQKKKDREALDKQYNTTIKNTDQASAPVRVDPWAKMRGSDDAKNKH